MHEVRHELEERKGCLGLPDAAPDDHTVPDAGVEGVGDLSNRRPNLQCVPTNRASVLAGEVLIVSVQRCAPAIP